MGSGEDLGYLKTSVSDNTSNSSVTVPSITTTSCNCWGNCTCGTWGGNSFTWTYNTKIFLYQIKCPECKVKTFMELEKITPCKGCGATLWASKNIPEYTVEVE